MRILTNRQNYVAPCLLAAAAIIGDVSSAAAQVPLGGAAQFALLGGTNVTCTGGAVVGNVGVAPGSAVPYTNTGCAVAGGTPPATNEAAALARTDFLSAYAALEVEAASSACTQVDGTLAGVNLPPGPYCLDGVAKTGLLTLTGPSTGIWTFLVNGALTGTNFSVVMAGGGQPCNVYWAPKLAATLTTSTMRGSILAGNTAAGSITLTGGSLVGRALANIAVTTTGTAVQGCSATAVRTGGGERGN